MVPENRKNGVHMTSSIIISIFDSIPLWVMITPILFNSIILLAVFIERMIFYKRIDIDYRLLIGSVKDNLRNNRPNESKMLCNKYSGPLVEMICTIIDIWNTDANVELSVKDISEKTIRSIEKYGGVVSTVATISPMLGLLGTVTGMMKSFSGLAKFGSSAQELLARGITEALITTAMGLLVAIPALIFYNYMVSKVELNVREVEFIANSFLKNTEQL